MLMFEFVVKFVYKSTTPVYKTHTDKPHSYERVATRALKIEQCIIYIHERNNSTNIELWGGLPMNGPFLCHK